MLEKSGFEFSNIYSTFSDEMIFEYLLVGLYKSAFSEAFENGIYKEYITEYVSTSKPKGQIDFQKLIDNFGLMDGKVHVSYRERSINNRINRLIIAAYKKLKRQFPYLTEKMIDNSDEKRELDFLSFYIPYNDQKETKIIQEAMKPISHPFFSNYEKLRIISIQILENNAVSPFDNDNDITNSILFYVPDLWEKFLEETLFKLDILNIGTVDSQNTITVVDSLSIRPDFIARNNQEEPILVLDAKFKPSWAAGRFDLNDYTKCIRDMNACNAHITGVIFPTNNNEFDAVRVNNISEYNQIDKFLRVKLLVPEQGESYTLFKEEIECNIQESAISLTMILNSLGY